MAKGQKGMGHEKAARARAVVTQVAEPGHGHTCPWCMKMFRHEDSKCINIGLAYHICIVCNAVEKFEIEGIPKIDMQPDFAETPEG